MFSDDLIEQLSMFIIRPPRQVYGISRMGPKISVVKSAITNTYIQVLRQEATIQHHNRTLQLSIFEPQNKNIYEIASYKNLPKHRNRSSVIEQREAFMSKSTQFGMDNCLNEKIQKSNGHKKKTQQFISQTISIFLHSNSGSRLEGIQYAKNLLQYHHRVCIFDYSASGMSEGEYVTMGLREADDLSGIINYLKGRYKTESFYLWGRSMGAVTAVIYASRYPQNVKKMVLDSPFSNFRELLKEIVSNRTGLPQFVYSPVMNKVEETIVSKINYNLMEIDLLKKVRQQKGFMNIPCLFLVSKEDKLVNYTHVESLYREYPGQKKLLYLEGSHNKPRPADIKDQCAEFLNKKILNCSNSKKKIQLKNSNFLKVMRKNSDNVNHAVKTKFSTSQYMIHTKTPYEHHSLTEIQQKNVPQFFIPMTPNQIPDSKNQSSTNSIEMIMMKKDKVRNQPSSTLTTERNKYESAQNPTNKQTFSKNPNNIKISLSQLKKNYIKGSTTAIKGTKIKQQLIRDNRGSIIQKDTPHEKIHKRFLFKNEAKLEQN